MTLAECQVNQRVCYIPRHAYRDPNHPDAEMGQVSSKNAKNVFVKFDKQLQKFGWEGTTSQACDPADLYVVAETYSRRRVIPGECV